MEFAKRALRQFFFIKDTVGATMQAVSLVNKAIQLLEIMVTMLALICRIFDYNPTYRGIRQIGNDIQDTVQLSTPSEPFCLFVTAIGLSLVPIVILSRCECVLLKRKYLFCWLISLGILVLRVIGQSAMVQVYFMLTLSQESFPITSNFRYFLAITMVLSELVVTVISYQQKPLGILHSFIPLLAITISSHITFVSIIIVYVLIMLLFSSSRAVLCFFLLFLFWIMGQTISQYLELSELIFCLIIIVLCLTSMFLQSTSTIPKDREKQISQYWPFIHRKEETKFSPLEYYFVQQLSISQSYECTTSVTRYQHLYLLSIMIEQSYLEPQVKYILKLKKKLEQETNYLSVLMEVHMRLRQINLTDLYLHYEMYTLLLRLERWSYKFKSYITFMNNVVELDQLSTKFHELMYEQLKTLADMWDKISYNTIDFTMIEPMYMGVIEACGELKALYGRMAQKNVEVESHRLSAFIEVVGGCTFHYSKTKDVQGANLQTPFLVMKDQRISFVSLKFAEEYGFNREDLVHSSIQSIVPQEIQKKLMSFYTEKADIRLKYEQQLMLNGQGYPTIVNTRCFITPDISSSITFIIFFYNELKATKRSCFVLFNPENEVVEDASEYFMLKYKISADRFTPNSQPLPIKYLFYGFQYDIDVHRKLSESTEGIVAILNLKNLTSKTIKFNRIKVNLRLLTVIEIQKKKRLVLEVGKYEEDNHRKSVDIRKEVRSSARADGSYMEEIEEANDKIKRGYARHSVKCMLVVLVTLASITIGFLIGLFVCSYARINQLTTAMQEINKSNRRNTLFSDIMFNNLVMVNLNYSPPQTLTPYYIKELKNKTSYYLLKTVKYFKQLYIRNINSSQFKPVYVDFQFPTYTKTLDTYNIFLMDLVWEASLLIYGTTTRLTLGNIGLLASLRYSAEAVKTMTDRYVLYFLLEDILSIGTTVVVVCSIVIFTFQRADAEKTLSEVEYLYQCITYKQIDEKIKAIKQIVGYCGKHRTANRDFRKQTYLSVKTEDDQAKYKIVKSRSHCSKMFKYFWRLLPGCLLIMIFAIFQIASTKAEAVSSPAIVQFANGLRIEQEAIQNSLVEYFYKPLVYAYNKTVYKPTFQSNLVNFVVTESPKIPLPVFVNNLWSHLNNNICGSNCTDIDGGVFELGYSKGINSYMKLLYELSLLEAKSLLVSSKLSQAKSSQQYILKNMDTIINSYSQEVDKYVDNMKIIHGVYLVFYFALLAITIYLFIRQYSQHCLRIDLCRILFSNLPMEVFTSVEVENRIKDGLLDRLNYL